MKNIYNKYQLNSLIAPVHLGLITNMGSLILGKWGKKRTKKKDPMCSCHNYATMVYFQRENIKCFKCIIYTLNKVLERSLALTSLLTNFKFYTFH